MSISTWACSEVLGFGCRYVLPVCVLNVPDSVLHLAQLTRTPSLLTSIHSPPLTILFCLLLCPSAHILPVFFVLLCLSASVLQCFGGFFSTFHLPSVLSLVSLLPNLIPYFSDFQTHRIIRHHTQVLEEENRKKKHTPLPQHPLPSEPCKLHLDYKMHPPFPPKSGVGKVRLIV